MGSLTWAHIDGINKGDDDEGLLCCWIVDCEDEQQMVGYATDFFEAKPDLLLSRYENGIGSYNTILSVVDVKPVGSSQARNLAA